MPHAILAEAPRVGVVPHFERAAAEVRSVSAEEAFDVVAVDRQAPVVAEAAAERRYAPEAAEANPARRRHVGAPAQPRLRPAQQGSRQRAARDLLPPPL